MKKDFMVNKKYLNIPICAQKEEKLLCLYLLDNENGTEEKFTAVMVPVDNDQQEKYSYDFYAQIPIAQYAGKNLRITVEDVPEIFLESICTSDEEEEAKSTHPVIHFAARNGWTNDPNGMVYADGVYHLYFQYNPFGVQWNNMSWGHAVSKDLLHWEQVDSVMFPDADGTIYSGCAIRNERGMLDLPQEALVFFYTAAGGNDEWSKGLQFTQKIAWSVDGGMTLHKEEKPCVPVIYRDSRDPKVYWHEESGAYIMALWLRGNDFGILRSDNLRDWKLVDEFTLKDAWECPDIFSLSAENGEKCWFFWSADGFYYEGTFDGYSFQTDGEKKCAYLTGVPYAAQTYYGTDERVISIPWLRLKNDGRTYTGAYGIPVELSCRRTENGFVMIQKPVRELWEQAVKVTEQLTPDKNNTIIYQQEKKKAMAIRMTIQENLLEDFRWKINGSWIEYSPEAGSFTVDRDAFQVKPWQQNLLFLVDDKILEVFFEDGEQMGTFELRNPEVSLELPLANVKEYDIFEIE